MRNNKRATIFSVLAIAGTAVTAGLSILAYKKVKEIGEQSTPKEVVKVVAPAVIAGLGTAACIISANVINTRYSNSINTAYVGALSLFESYRLKVIEKFGKDVDISIYESISNERPGNWEDYEDVNDDILLFYEPLSDQFLERSMRFVIEAAYHFNRNYALGGYVTLNDYLEFLGAEKVPDELNKIWSWGLMDESGLTWIDFIYRLVSDGSKTHYFIIETPFGPFDPEEDL